MFHATSCSVRVGFESRRIEMGHLRSLYSAAQRSFRECVMHPISHLRGDDTLLSVLKRLLLDRDIKRYENFSAVRRRGDTIELGLDASRGVAPKCEPVSLECRI